MLKTIHTLTIGDYRFFEKTGDSKYLFDGKVIKHVSIAGLLQEINIGLSGENENSNKLQKELHKVKSQYRIQLLITLYEAVYNIMVLQKDINEWRELAGLKQTNVLNLSKYTDKIKKATNIEINSIDDLEKLKKEIERWVDKFAENFPESDIEPDGITFIQMVLGVFAATNMSLDYKMYLSDFFELKKEAEQLNKMIKQKQTEKK